MIAFQAAAVFVIAHLGYYDEEVKLVSHPYYGGIMKPI
jgi:hypothetical protein